MSRPKLAFTSIKYKLTFIILSLLVTASHCMADISDLFNNNKFQFHGFGSQSYLHTSDNDFFGTSENGSFEFFEFGINGIWQPTTRFKLASQLVARDAGKSDDGKFRIDYSFLDYIISNEHNKTGIRAGRIVNPYGLYNDTRDIAATRPSILLPQSIYFDVNRNFALSSDGFQIYHENRKEMRDIFIQLGLFEPRTEDPDFEPAIFFQKAPGNLEGTPSWMARILYEYDFGRIRLGLTASEVNVEYNPGSADSIFPGEFHFRPFILSAQYNSERWSFTGEVARRTSELEKFNPGRNTKFSGTSFFIQGTYRTHANWRLLIRYDELIWNNNDRDGKKFQAATGRVHYSRFAKDWTIGARWDLNQYTMLHLEWHRVNGTGWLSLLETPQSIESEQYWNLFAVSASIRF